MAAASLTPDLAEMVALALLEQYSVWYKEKPEEPWHDLEGILLDACNLVRAAAGDENCAAALVASHLFSFLSPHLGCSSRGTGPQSSVADMKALLKYWRLPQTGKKGELQARIKEQVEVAKVPVTRDGVTALVTPAHSRVSVAAFRVLRKSARDTERISQSKCKDIFGLSESRRNELPSGYIWDGRTSFPAKMFLLREVKAAALVGWQGRQRSWVEISNSNKRMANWRVDYDAARKLRSDRLAEALVARGWEPTGADGAEEFVKGHYGGVYTWGAKEGISIEAAADFCELMKFCSTTAAELFRACLGRSLTECYVRPSLSEYKKSSAREDWAANKTLTEWARGQPSMESIASNWRVPRSLLPKMERARA